MIDYQCPNCRGSFSLPFGVTCDDHHPEPIGPKAQEALTPWEGDGSLKDSDSMLCDLRTLAGFDHRNPRHPIVVIMPDGTVGAAEFHSVREASGVHLFLIRIMGKPVASRDLLA